jgi:hypothetical protein
MDRHPQPDCARICPALPLNAAILSIQPALVTMQLLTGADPEREKVSAKATLDGMNSCQLADFPARVKQGRQEIKNMLANYCG